MAKRSSSKTGKKGSKNESLTSKRMTHKGSKHKKLSDIVSEAEVAILDGDGTSWDWTEAATKLYNKVGAEYGLHSVTKSEVRNIYYGRSPKSAFRMMGLSEKDARSAAKTYDRDFNTVRKEYVDTKGVEEVIHHYEELGIPVAMVSRASKQHVDTGLDVVTEAYNRKYGTRKSKSQLFNSIRYGSSKPSEKDILKAMKRAKAKSAVVHGDDAVDIRAAENANEASKGNVYSIGHLEKSYDSSHEFEGEPDRLTPDMKTYAHQLEAIVESKRAKSLPPGNGTTQLSHYRALETSGVKEIKASAGYNPTQLWNSYREAA